MENCNACHKPSGTGELHMIVRGRKPADEFIIEEDAGWLCAACYDRLDEMCDAPEPAEPLEMIGSVKVRYA